MTPAASEIETYRHAHLSEWTYRDLQRRQFEIQARVFAGGPGAILLSEVAPVITLGRRTPLTDLTLSRAEYERLGIEILPTDRGGLATYHGPGQWVIFPVDTLLHWTGDSRGVRKFVDSVLAATLEVLKKRVPDAEIRTAAGQTGIFSNIGKLASMGIRVDRGIVLHGIAVNGFATPESFLGLRPCGQDVRPDYCLKNIPGPSRETEFQQLGNELASILQNLSKP